MSDETLPPDQGRAAPPPIDGTVQFDVASKAGAESEFTLNLDGKVIEAPPTRHETLALDTSANSSDSLDRTLRSDAGALEPASTGTSDRSNESQASDQTALFTWPPPTNDPANSTVDANQ